jgi:TRAP-type C4-dicarboxylate transport system substrate-binding protein
VIKRVFFAILLVILVGSPLYSLTIKLGSVAPANSPWGKALHRLAGHWSRITDGKVKLMLYLGGRAGNEPDMIRKIRIGQLHGAAVSALGMESITSDVMTLTVPFFIQNENEFDYVLEKMKPHFDKELEDRNFKALTWSFSGWVHLFARKPVIFPADLAEQKLGIPMEDTDILQIWRSIGVDAFTVSVVDLMLALQGGMVDAFYSPPLVAAAFQWFAFSNHMSLLRILPIYGSIIIKDSIWKRVPDEYKPEMLDAVQEIQEKFSEEFMKLEEEALAVMKKHGLVVHQVSTEAEKEWRKLLEKGVEPLIGVTYSKEYFEMMKSYLEEFRRNRR